MGFWQIGLLVFGLLWGVQIAGTALQMRHYRATLKAISDRWADGFVGSGSARARFGAGAIAIVVASPAGTVRQVLAMHGRTVFAKFKPVASLEGTTLGQLRDGSALPQAGKLGGAIQAAVAQLDRIAADRAAAQTDRPLQRERHAPAESIGAAPPDAQPHAA